MGLNPAIWDYDEERARNQCHTPPEPQQTPGPGREFERLAWYSPAHTNLERDYGIHISDEGLVKVAEDIQQRLLYYHIKLSKTHLLIFAAYLLLAHETCHGWIEDMLSMMQFCSLGDKYSSKLKYPSGYAIIEEALCNTAAYGWFSVIDEQEIDYIMLMESSLPDVFECKTIGLVDLRHLCASIADFQLSQPPGYRDYVIINNHPKSDPLFIINIWRLIVDGYYGDEVKQRRLPRPDFFPSMASAYFGVDVSCKKNHMLIWHFPPGLLKQHGINGLHGVQGSRFR